MISWISHILRTSAKLTECKRLHGNDLYPRNYKAFFESIVITTIFIYTIVTKAQISVIFLDNKPKTSQKLYFYFCLLPTFAFLSLGNHFEKIYFVFDIGVTQLLLNFLYFLHLSHHILLLTKCYLGKNVKIFY